MCASALIQYQERHKGLDKKHQPSPVHFMQKSNKRSFVFMEQEKLIGTNHRIIFF